MTPEEIEMMKKAAGLGILGPVAGADIKVGTPVSGETSESLRIARELRDKAALERQKETTSEGRLMAGLSEGGSAASQPTPEAGPPVGVRDDIKASLAMLSAPEKPGKTVSEKMAEAGLSLGKSLELRAGDPGVVNLPPVSVEGVPAEKPKARSTGSSGGYSRIPSSHYYPEDFAERMQMAYATGKLSKDEFSRQMKGFRQWEQGTKGTYAGMQRAKADTQVLADAAQVQYEADIASAEAKAAEAQLNALDQMQNSREYWQQLNDMYQQRMDQTMQELQDERDKLKASAPNIMGGVAEGILDAVALAMGQYSAVMGGGPNAALQIIQQRTNKRIAQAKLEAQNSAQIQDSLAREFGMLQNKFQSEQVAEKMLYGMMLDETASRISAIGKLGGSEAVARRSENMLAAIQQAKFATEAEVKHAVTVQHQKELQAAAAARQKALDKARTKALARMALSAAGGRPMSDERPAGDPITIQGVNGASMKGFAPSGIVSAYHKSRDGLRMAKQSAENLIRLESETDLMGANPTTLFSGGKGTEWNQNATLLLKGMKDAGSAVGAWDKGAQELLEPFDFGGRFDLLTTEWGKKFYTEEKLQAVLDIINQVEQQSVNSVMEHIEPWSEEQIPYWDEDAEMMGFKNVYIRGRETPYSQGLKRDAADLAAQTGGFAGTLK